MLLLPLLAFSLTFAASAARCPSEIFKPKPEIYTKALVPCLESSCPPKAMTAELFAREFCAAFANGMAGVYSCGFMAALGCPGARKVNKSRSKL
ncbi:hypothetical protein B0H11DRAFT_685337 [Mycena galericulata]|nr:hypothetical protein B0H11DRAFT_685337 [Mycena galericulata]